MWWMSQVESMSEFAFARWQFCFGLTEFILRALTLGKVAGIILDHCMGGLDCLLCLLRTQRKRVGFRLADFIL